MSRRKVAFVVQRCGREVNGGGEAHCLAIAQRMSSYWETEILTTCAVDYVDWKNHYPPGVESVGDVPIRRFPVASPRVTQKFNDLSAIISAKGYVTSLGEEEDWMNEQGPRCPALIEYIDRNCARYDVFIFFTYLYWHTWAGFPRVAAKAILVPLAHDEWTIRLGIFRSIFARAKYFIFNSVEERQLLHHVFPDLVLRGQVVGVAVDRPTDVNPARFRARFRLHEPFLLYVGRVDPSKGCRELVDYFIRHRAEGRHPRKLVLLGKSVMHIPNHPDIVALGFVADDIKWDALAASSMLVMPSINESLSLVLLEAWSVGKPVLVNGRCQVLVGQCQRSNGGLWYEDYEEWARALSQLQSGATSSVLGRQGWRFVRDQYSWKDIEQAYLIAVEELTQAEAGSKRKEVAKMP